VARLTTAPVVAQPACTKCSHNDRQHEMLLCDGVARRQCQKAYHGSCLSPALNAATLVGRFEGPCCLPGMWAQLAASMAASSALAAAAAAPTPALPLTTRPAAPQRRGQGPNAPLTGSAAPARVSRPCPTTTSRTSGTCTTSAS
jgi:hypothetical protein